MKVYIAIDIKGIHANNPFTTELIRGVQNAGPDVTTGLFRLDQNGYHPDIIHFQWPERIFQTKPNEADITWLEERLNYFKKSTKIAVTVHNEVPHKKDWSTYEKVYGLVYRYADGFVHMGEVSKRLLCERFPNESADKLHVVIPHGNYVVFGKQADKNHARKHLNLPNKKGHKVALIVGSVRKVDELKRIKSFARIIYKLNGTLVFAGDISLEKPNFTFGKTALKRILSELKQLVYELRLKNTLGLIFRPGRIPHPQMALYLSTADAMVIPRGRVLNSGNVALGFTYGLVVVGPDSGNVGEVLKSFDNPTFHPDMDESSLQSAIEDAFALSDQGQGLVNQKIAMSDWSWEKIGKHHLNFYNNLLKQNS